MSTVTGSLTLHRLGQMRHLDLLALCYEIGVVTAGTCGEVIARQPKESLVELLSRPQAQGRLRERAGRRLRG